MDKNKTIKEVEKVELSSNQNLLERLSSIEYRLDDIGEKFTTMTYEPSFADKWPNFKVYPVITSDVQFGYPDHKVNVNLYGEHFSKSNYLIRTAYISVIHTNLVDGWGYEFIPPFPKNVPIDENGKFHLQIQISVGGDFKIVARNNSTDEYAQSIRFHLDVNERGFFGYGNDVA